MKDMTDDIIDYISTNRVSTTEVADVLNKTGLLDSNIKPITPHFHIVGRIFYAPAFNGSNYYAHYFLREAIHDSIAYVEGIHCDDKAIFGDLVAKYTILYKKLKGIVVSGLVRDAHLLIKEKYPIWSYGFTPIGCINSDTGIDMEYYTKQKEKFDGSILVCDDSGVVIVYKNQLTTSFYEGLKRIEDQEDTWYDCIDRLKYSTFDTVCKKIYQKP